MTLESLRALSAIESSEWWRCRRASLPWVRQAHEQNSVQFADLKELFRPTESSIGPSAMDFALNLVKENVPVGDDEFPGTLCSPLRRTHLRQIHTEPYWMTEKSDGLRVIATLLECESFPTWRRADGTLFADSVQLVAALESRVAGDGMDLFPSLGGHHFTLEPSGEAIYTLTVEGSAPVTLHRRLERVLLTYAFDRLMDQLYLFDIFYQSSSMPFSRCIIDGELMQVCNADGTCGADLTQLVIGFFDLFSLQNKKEGSVVVTDALSERYHLLTDVLRALDGSRREPPPLQERSAHWFAKEMWKTGEYGPGFAMVHQVNERVYTVHRAFGYTRNDGFIFTPEAFPLRSGSSRDQVKWKWQSLLSVDFLLAASDKNETEYRAGCYFKKHNYGHREDSVGHWSVMLPMDNPHQYSIPLVTERGVVGECVYDFPRRVWCIERLRGDKVNANSIVTVLSVMESMVENVVITELSGAKRCAADIQATPISSPPKMSTTHRQSASFSLRASVSAHGKNTLQLLSYTNRTNPDFKNPIPFGFCEVGECEMFTNGPLLTGRALENALNIELANAGGSAAWTDFVVRAFFDGSKGKWVLEELIPNGNNKQCGFNNVLEHLQYILSLDAGARKVFYEKVRTVQLSFTSTIKNTDTKLTNDHYGEVAVKEGTGVNRDRSNLRIFNNWIKSIKLSSTAASIKKPLFVFDLCCGRGGDLPKWKQLSPKFVFMVDSSEDCVAVASHRYSTTHGSLKVGKPSGSSFPACFRVFDVFDEEGGLDRAISSLKNKYRGAFNLVSCQFSLHYGCSSESKMDFFLKCVSSALVPGGYFVGTTVNDTVLLNRVREKGTQFGNSVYTIRMCGECPTLPVGDSVGFGLKYTTSVENLVTDTPEYVVPWKAFCALCEKHHLTLEEDASLLEYFQQNIETEMGKNLCALLSNKRSRDGSINLSQEETEAILLYRVFSFKRRDDQPTS